MNFRPSTEKELAANRVWLKGAYDFLVIEAEETVSASRGNPMLVLTIEITRRDGEKRTIKDYLLPQRPDKLLHACRACGVEDKYEAGLLSEDDFVGKRGRLDLGIQTSKVYPTKNVVRDYL